MKFFVGLTALLSISVWGSEIRVSKMSQENGLERSFVLKTNLPDTVVIDCQSFIQGLRIGEYEQAFTYLLDPEECEGLQFRIRNSLLKMKNHCIVADDEIRADYGCR